MIWRKKKKKSHYLAQEQVRDTTTKELNSFLWYSKNDLTSILTVDRISWSGHFIVSLSSSSLVSCLNIPLLLDQQGLQQLDWVSSSASRVGAVFLSLWDSSLSIWFSICLLWNAAKTHLLNLIFVLCGNALCLTQLKKGERQTNLLHLHIISQEMQGENHWTNSAGEGYG